MLRRPRNSRLLVLFGMSLVAASSVVVPAASAAPVTTDSVSGHIYGLNGKSLTAGKRVNLIVWPRNEDLARLRVGERVPTKLVATALTDSTGRYTLTYPSAEQLRPFASPLTGAANLTVESYAGGLPYDFALSRDVTSAARPDAAGTAPQRQSVDLRPAKGATPLPKAVQRQLNANPSPDGQVPCGRAKLADIGPRWVQVGRAFSTTNTSATMTYNSGASSSLGVGVAANLGAQFTASGTNSVGSNATVEMTKVSGYHTSLWRTQFFYSKFGFTCAGSGTWVNITVQATAFTGGASTKFASRPKADNCVSQAKGSSFIKDESRSTTFSAGASTSGDIGINLSAQTGYSHSTSIRFNFAAKRRLCGTTGYPGASPGVMRAKE